MRKQLVGLACIALALGACSSSKSAAPKSTTSSSSTTSTTAAATTTQSLPVTLPVVGCATSHATSPGAPMTSVPPITLAPNVASQLAVYHDDENELVVLAPRGWVCSGQIGADGSALLSVAPAGTTPPTGAGTKPDIAITAETTGGCAGCMAQAVCAFLSDPVITRMQVLPCPPVPTGETVTHVQARLARFRDPAGVHGTGIPSGGPNAASGAILLSGGSPTSDPVEYSATCTVPADQNSVCTAMLDDFAHRHPLS